MKRIVSHLQLASAVRIANSWLLTDSSERRFLVDTGYFTDRPALWWHLRQAGLRRPGDLQGVLLTHRHSDHAANAAWLRAKFDCPVICHEADARFLQLEQRPRKMAFLGKASRYEDFLNLFEDTYPARSTVDETFREGTWKWGFSVIPTPGHTEGSVMLYHEPTHTLFSGDSILAGVPPFRSIERLRLALPGFSQSTELCHAKVGQFLRALPKIDVVCSGHGPAITRDARTKLARLAALCPSGPDAATLSLHGCEEQTEASPHALSSHDEVCEGACVLH